MVIVKAPPLEQEEEYLYSAQVIAVMQLRPEGPSSLATLSFESADLL